MRFKASAAGVAIYDEVAAGGDGPFTSPLSNLGKIRFHSALKYPAIIASPAPVSVTLPEVGTNQSQVRGQVELYTHGLGYIPYIEGKITAIGSTNQVVGLCGSVPVQQLSSPQSFLRCVHLGANSTKVLLNWYVTTPFDAVFSQLALTVQIYVLDVQVA